MRRLFRRLSRQSRTSRTEVTYTEVTYITPGTSTITTEALLQGALEGDLQAVQRSLNAGTSVEVKDDSGFTPLLRAVQHGHGQIALLLLSRGASTCATTSSGIAPLHLAIAAHDATMAAVLLDHGASIELPMGQNGVTPFHLAVGTGREELVKLLLERGANPKARCQPERDDGETVLHSAISAGKDELLPLLLATGLDVNAAGGSPAGRTPLHIAASRGYEAAVQTLLDAGADVSPRYYDGRTPLHLAAEYDQVAVIELLLERGAPVMAATPDGETALCTAASHGRKAAASIFLRQTLHVLTEAQKAKVIISAARAGSIDVVELLVRQGFSVNACEDLQYSPLEAAAVNLHEGLVIFLLRNGARPDPSAIRATRHINHKTIPGLLNGKLPLPAQRNMSPETLPSNIRIDGLEAALAGIATTSWRRRTTPSTNPGDLPPDCWVCQDLDFRKGRPRDLEIIHLTTGRDLAFGAQHGCPGCTMIRQCLAHLAASYNKDLAARKWNTADESITLLSLVRGGPLYIVPGPIIQNHETVRAEVYSHPSTPVTWPIVGVARDMSVTPWSDQRRSLVRTFLGNCLTNHAKCSYTESMLPTRVIDVGSETQDPHLHISHIGDCGPYVTLSHCWGASSPTTTTSGTIQARTMGIPLGNLPKTFLDAVLITRDLGVRYLWIDSLCIIQDSHEDWEREAARMSEVYSNGYVMLAADGSDNCHGGCFPRTGSLSFPIAVEGPCGRSSKVFCRLTNLLSDDRGEVCHRLHGPHDGFKPNALDTRGWTLQERILAPRILHLGRSEIGWECADRRACECQVVSTQTDFDSRFKTHLANFQSQSSDQSNLTTAKVENRWLWSNIVQEFTRRNLTNSNDILPALSGLAKRMCLGAEGEYVSGMWKEKLSGFLMWQPDYGFIRRSSLSGVPKRHKEYYAPSWSWASVIGPVMYKDQGAASFHGGKREPYPINRGESSWNDGSMLEVLQIRGVPKGLNPFGPPRSAALNVRGFVAPARFHSKVKGLPAQSSTNGGLLLGTDTSSYAQADFEPDVPDAYAEVSLGDVVYLLFTAESRQAGDGISSYAWGRGLVLTESGGLYSRVGTFRFQDNVRWEKWRELRDKRTIWMI